MVASDQIPLEIENPDVEFSDAQIASMARFLLGIVEHKNKSQAKPAIVEQDTQSGGA